MQVNGQVLDYLMDEIDYLAVIYYNKDNRKDNSILTRLEQIGKFVFLHNKIYNKNISFRRFFSFSNMLNKTIEFPPKLLLNKNQSFISDEDLKFHDINIVKVLNSFLFLINRSRFVKRNIINYGYWKKLYFGIKIHQNHQTFNTNFNR